MIILRQIPRAPSGMLKTFLDLLLKKQLIVGDSISEFERGFSEYIGAKYAFSLSSSRIGLLVLLDVLGIRKGDEVILPSLTCPVVPSIIAEAGAIPVFCDVNPETFNMDAKTIKERLSSKTKAIIATHIEGMPCDMNEIRELSEKYDIKIIEDCAQALGAEYNGKKVGTFGDASLFSFAYGKQLKTMGGGMLLTNDKSLAEAICLSLTGFSEPKLSKILKKSFFQFVLNIFLTKFFQKFIVFPLILFSNVVAKDLINTFFEDKGYTDKLGRYKVKLSNFQAVLGILQLKYLEDSNNERINNAKFVSENLSTNVKKQKQLPNCRSVYCYYSIDVTDSDNVKNKLLLKGVDSQKSWNRSCSSLALFKKYATDCPVADKLANEILYIPAYPGLKEKELFYIVEQINKVLV